MLDCNTFNFDPDAPARVDYMVPGRGEISMSGNWARRLLDNELDVGCMRPFISNDGRRTYVSRYLPTTNKEGKLEMVPRAVPTYNDTNATLRFLDWIQLDQAVIEAAKPRLKIVNDIRSRGLTYMLPAGIAKTIVQFQQQSDITGATVSMDGLRSSESDRPVFSTIQFPLPIIHKDFQFPLRQVLASRTGYSPLDMTTAKLAGARVAEQVEQMTLGCGPNTQFQPYAQFQGVASYTWGGVTVYGLMNFPQRNTYSITLPTADGWVPQQTVDDILFMKKISQLDMQFGPWMVYHGLYWDPYMDDDYKATYNDMTLRERIEKIDGILGVENLDYIPDQSLIMVQMQERTIRMVQGMDITTVQWETHGGLQLNFKVMCVIVPHIRTDFYSNIGIVHGS